MSPRRKTGLRAEHLAALKHLPAVLEALEALQVEHGKVRALMGPARIIVREERLRTAGFEEPSPADLARGNYGAGLPPSRNPALDTPERREYEEARRAGRKVPAADPFANASPAQRERMAEQRAALAAEKAAKGLPAKTNAFGETAEQRREMAEAIRDLAEVDAEVSVRTETLDTVSDGTTPLASDGDDDLEPRDSSGGHN